MLSHHRSTLPAMTESAASGAGGSARADLGRAHDAARTGPPTVPDPAGGPGADPARPGAHPGRGRPDRGGLGAAGARPRRRAGRPERPGEAADRQQRGAGRLRAARRPAPAGPGGAGQARRPRHPPHRPRSDAVQLHRHPGPVHHRRGRPPVRRLPGPPGRVAQGHRRGAALLRHGRLRHRLPGGDGRDPRLRLPQVPPPRAGPADARGSGSAVLADRGPERRAARLVAAVAAAGGAGARPATSARRCRTATGRSSRTRRWRTPSCPAGRSPGRSST